MKTKTTLVLAALLGAALPLLAVPQPEIVPEEAPAAPAAGAEPEAVAPELGDPKKKGIGFLGVSALEAPPAQLQQHKVEQGVSLMTVMAGGPAAKAGLAVGDIITQVGEVKIATMLDLRAAIRAHKEDDQVILKVIQKGKLGDVKVTLAAAPPDPPGALPGGVQIMPGAQFGGGLRLNFGGAGGAFRMGDGEGSIEMKGQGEGREVTVRDHADAIVFEGPWVTPQDKAAAPTEIRHRVERLAGIFGEDAFFGNDFVLPDPIPVQPQFEPIKPPQLKLEFERDVPAPGEDELDEAPPAPPED